MKTLPVISDFEYAFVKAVAFAMSADQVSN